MVLLLLLLLLVLLRNVAVWLHEVLAAVIVYVEVAGGVVSVEVVVLAVIEAFSQLFISVVVG